uniref:FTH domain-containing protein n=1 Tax=Panagrellus redivivus TaxID=6233 RepID=A0A7E4V2G8_PANRE
MVYKKEGNSKKREESQRKWSNKHKSGLKQCVTGQIQFDGDVLIDKKPAMSFSLESLPYGLRQRLRELVTPSEAYEFQIAAPKLVGLQPIQKIQDIYSVSLSISNETVLCATDLERYQSLKVSENTLYNANYSLDIRNFKPQSSYQLIFDHFRVAPTNVYFNNCSIDASLIQNFANHMKRPVTHLFFNKCTFQSDSMAQVISSAFKSLTTLSFNEICPFQREWLDVFVAAKYSNMRHLFLYGSSVDVLNINSDTFMQFYKVQSDSFSLRIRLHDDVDTSKVEQRLNALFGENFKFQSDCVNLPQKHVAVMWGSHQLYYFLLEHGFFMLSHI